MVCVAGLTSALMWSMTAAGRIVDAGAVPGNGLDHRSDARPRYEGTGAPSLLPDPVAVVPGSLERQPSADPPAPTHLSIPALGVEARIVPVGVERSGEIQVPSDVRLVGHYRLGPAPGLAGNAVLLGHVDSRLQGPGVFFGLSTLNLGELVSVTMENERRLSFRVVARRLFPREALPARVFSKVGSPVLVLITCGGSFDEDARRYSDNLVIYAVPES
jgi:hypothetical protein